MSSLKTIRYLIDITKFGYFFRLSPLKWENNSYELTTNKPGYVGFGLHENGGRKYFTAIILAVAIIQLLYLLIELLFVDLPVMDTSVACGLLVSNVLGIFCFFTFKMFPKEICNMLNSALETEGILYDE